MRRYRLMLAGISNYPVFGKGYRQNPRLSQIVFSFQRHKQKAINSQEL